MASPAETSSSPPDSPATPVATQPPLPTHFLSGASQRLTELQLHLNLNPDQPPTPTPTPPNESDPLLSYRLPTPPPRPPTPVRLIRLHRKMGTFDGVYLPTILSIFNVIFFLRFSYCVAIIGLLPTVGLLFLAASVNTLTVFSLSAIATNGQVRGGGAYYLISRTLGPEFGGSIGILFCLNQALTASMNIIGLVESATSISRLNSPTAQPLSLSITYLLKTAALFAATWTSIALGRTKIFSSMARSMASILAITILSILISFFIRKPFSLPDRHFVYTGLSLATLRSNLFPPTTPAPTPADYQAVFGIIFPSVSGILAGSSLSGELRKPSKSLPKGILSALASVMVIYVISLVGLSSSVENHGLRLAVGAVS